MKILIDINLTPKWRAPLEAVGHEVKHWSEVGDQTAPDSELMGWARKNGFVVFTNDLDFGAILYTTGARAPSVIQIRGDDVRPATMAAAVIKALSDAGDEIQAGALITLDSRQNRIAILPLGNST